MVNFWATYCGACIQHMPYLSELDKEYRDQGFQILGVITDVSKPEDDAVLSGRFSSVLPPELTVGIPDKSVVRSICGCFGFFLIKCPPLNLEIDLLETV